MDNLIIPIGSDGQQHKDADPNTTTDESVLTPVETSSNLTEPEPSKGPDAPRSADQAVDHTKKGALKAELATNGGMTSDLKSDDNAAMESDLEDVSSSSDSEDEVDAASGKAASKKKKRRVLEQSSPPTSSCSIHHQPRTKKNKQAIESDDETGDLNTENTEDDSGESSATPKVSLKKQVQSLTEQLDMIQKQLFQPNTHPLPQYGAPGYYPAPGTGPPYGYGPGMPYAAPSVATPRPGTTLKSATKSKKSTGMKDLDASRSRFESLFSINRNPMEMLGLTMDGLPGRVGGRGLSFPGEDEELNGDGKSKKPTRPEFKRVDSVWDTRMHNFRLKDTVENLDNAGYDKYVFHVRRTFDFENKYRTTYVDVKSKLLREGLQEVIGNVKGFSLVDETPKIPPNMLFLYLEEIRTHLNSLKQTKPTGETDKEIKKNRRRLANKRNHLKLLVKYLDTDYAKTKESLGPMLKNGIITYELLWALWKPSTLAYTTTYGSSSEPRVFKVDMSQEINSILNGNYYLISGKYFEYDGKKFGYGSMAEEIPEFQGTRKISSLAVYPLQYHQHESQVRADLIDRGKKFVSLAGVQYKAYQGLAFQKRKKGQMKFHIQKSRIMVDPAIFRRINPNYCISAVKSKNHDVVSDCESSDSDSTEDCCDDSDSSSAAPQKKSKFVTKFYKNTKGDVCAATIPKHMVDTDEPEKDLDVVPAKNGGGENGEDGKKQDNVEENGDQNGDQNGGEKKHQKSEEDKGKAPKAKQIPQFTDEEYLLASPVVLGFSFSEKQWLELAVSKVKDIKWNDKAWDSLVLEKQTKDLIKALVESRTYHAASTIDDVIQGKGKGLVTVLHGPPGTGKTLTAEGISELLKCPLYMVSAGELGTDSRFLEAELQKILDICHTWGAILLLDEADVFLEKRDMHNIHRNALVSVFLRQLEYFQGILFLTTNRVETFDEAFQSRIHIALRYENLDAKAKRKIFKMFVDRVQTLGKIEVKPLTEDDLTMLSKQDLNGREIKNVIGSAQDLAANKGEALSMRHIRQVLNVHAKFGRDLKGGTGYEDAMRSYF